MCERFHTGSNRPLANRNARMLSTDSLPRKWSMRKICDSSKTACTALPSSIADFRSVPNGFSMTTLDRSPARPASPSIATTEAKAAGGTARWNSRRGEPPISFSARSTSSLRGVQSSGSAGAKDRCFWNSVQQSISRPGLLMQKSSAACLACSRNSSVLIANLAGEEPMMRYLRGSRLAAARWNRPGSSLRLARSPVAPNSTMT